MIIPEDKKPKLNSLIDSLNINNVWIEKDDELFDLYNFIQEKVINNKILDSRNIMNNSDFIGINLDEDNEKDDGYIEKDIIVDEVNDDDNDLENDNDTDNLNDIVFPEEKNEEINIIQQDNINGNNIINQISNIENINGQEILNNLISNGNLNPELLNIIYQNNNNITPNIINNLNENEINNNNNNIDNINDKNEEDLSLEELGVKEVDDDIFGENFDESKVPILKKNNVRCKGYAAKFKTNQNSRPLLMSEHVRDNNSKNSNNDSNNNLNIDNNNNNISNNSGNINLSINNAQNKNNIIIPLNEKEKEKTESDFNDAPDLTQKKKNIRPLNGFRPATPPLKDAFTQQICASNNNFNNIFNNNLNEINTNSIKQTNKSKNKIESMKSSHPNNMSSLNNNNKKAKEKGKISSSRRQSNRGKQHHKKKERKIFGKEPRAKSEELIIKNRYVLKGVEIFIRRNKKNKKKKNSKNDVTDNKKIEINKKDNISIKINEDKIDKNLLIKINNEKEQKIKDEDDIIFNDFLKLDNRNNQNENGDKDINDDKNKAKYIQRPNDKKKNGSHSLNLK